MLKFSIGGGLGRTFFRRASGGSEKTVEKYFQNIRFRGKRLILIDRSNYVHAKNLNRQPKIVWASIVLSSVFGILAFMKVKDSIVAERQKTMATRKKVT